MKGSLFGAVALAAVAATAVLIGTASAAKPPPVPSNNTCPTNAKNLPTSNIVGASASSSGSISTYTFESFTNPAQTSQGTPGLVNYCVYTIANPGPSPVTVNPLLKGADDSPWVASKPGKNFGFSRPGGEKTNIELNGQTVTMGTATWPISAPAPTAQTIVLHISNAGECAALGIASPTCFVLPGTKPGPVCDAAAAGDANAAYNNIPKDAVNCGPPSHAFEATQTKEFGDEVTLGKSGNLQSLTVLFNSYACKDYPLWNNNQCTTNPLSDPVGDTFTHTITANIYGASSNGVPGALLATATQEFTIPYRPSADPAVCGLNGGDGARWFNPASGTCTYSKKVLLKFTDWRHNDQPVSPHLTGNVVWTVAYNTTHAGYNPIGEVAGCTTSTAGCPYDSLNVGTKTFANSAYAGAYVDDHGAFINSTWTGIYCDNGVGGTGTLRASTNPPSPCNNFGASPATPDTPSNPNYEKDAWLGYQPLGMIVLTST